MIILLGVIAFFGLAYLVTWNICRGLTLDSTVNSEERPVAPVQASSVSASAASNYSAEGHCMLCNAPLRSTELSRDSILVELERRIGDDTAAIGRILHKPAPETIHSLYVN